MNLFKQNPPTDKPPAQETSLVEWLTDEFLPRFGKQTLYILLGILVVVGGAVFYKSSRESQAARENKLLGRAYVYYGDEKLDSALAVLSDFTRESHSRLVQDKANLMLGRVYFGQKKYDEAIKAYGQVSVSTSHSLVSSGALHGLAASHMQKKEYAQAAASLEKFVSTFMRRTGAPSEKMAGKEVVDLSPAVPNALWKLTLCYRELKDTEKAKATAKKLTAVYPESREAYDAARLLAQIP